MSLDNIQLPPSAVAALFRKSLVEINNTAAAEIKTGKRSINCLGKNGSGILILVRNEEVAFLPDDELNFLLGVLNACKLNMDDVGIVNLAKNDEADYKVISQSLGAKKIFLFGAGSGDIKLPLSFPHYQVQQYNNQVYLTAPSLSALQSDKTEKTKLWNSLKQIFSL